MIAAVHLLTDLNSGENHVQSFSCQLAIAELDMQASLVLQCPPKSMYKAQRPKKSGADCEHNILSQHSIHQPYSHSMVPGGLLVTS